MTGSTDFFEEVEDFPNATAKRRYDELIGLDPVKDRLIKEARLLLQPELLEQWSKEHHHRKVISATSAFRERHPLFVFAGDVGTGKTALAETFGDAVARAANLDILLFKMSLRARGSGSVGEMTQLITSAFDYARQQIPPLKQGKKPMAAGVLLIDEADALAQSRELAQMHHEDRAGVNALIRGINGITTHNHPIITVMCSNRLSALDPAIQRRAADIVQFRRPTKRQRIALLDRNYADAGFTAGEIEQLADLTGETAGRDYGYTFSDLAVRLIPSTVLDAFDDKPLQFARVAEVAAETLPTAPFSQEDR
jgi:SpoVK/Ycf46/Vps4 family AAA+-type ATPase